MNTVPEKSEKSALRISDDAARAMLAALKSAVAALEIYMRLNGGSAALAAEVATMRAAIAIAESSR